MQDLVRADAFGLAQGAFNVGKRLCLPEFRLDFDLLLNGAERQRDLIAGQFDVCELILRKTTRSIKAKDRRAEAVTLHAQRDDQCGFRPKREVFER